MADTQGAAIKPVGVANATRHDYMVGKPWAFGLPPARAASVPAAEASREGKPGQGKRFRAWAQPLTSDPKEYNASLRRLGNESDIVPIGDVEFDAALDRGDILSFIEAIGVKSMGPMGPAPQDADKVPV